MPPSRVYITPNTAVAFFVWPRYAYSDRPVSRPVVAGFSHAQVKAPTYYFKKFIEEGATTVGAGHV